MASAVEAPAEKKEKKTASAAFKVVPETRELRDLIRTESGQFVKTIDRSKNHPQSIHPVTRIEPVTRKASERRSPRHP